MQREEEEEEEGELGSRRGVGEETAGRDVGIKSRGKEGGRVTRMEGRRDERVLPISPTTGRSTW